MQYSNSSLQLLERKNMENTYEKRTDLAMEAEELWRKEARDTTELLGVEAREERCGAFKVTTVKILDDRGEKALGKPEGSYITIELDALMRREENAFRGAARLLADHLRELLALSDGDSVLVVGLGNEAITPDAVGPEAANSVLVTRHLRQRMPREFSAFREVSVIRSGVLGTTGMESADMVRAVMDALKPSCVIAIDALASCQADRLCRTVQLADTGIVPGSGVGNSRAGLNAETLGVPVLAIGVPTVVDAVTLAVDIADRSGVEMPSLEEQRGMIVTPRDIDKNVHDVSKLIGYAINMALHNNLTVEEIDMFL